MNNGVFDAAMVMLAFPLILIVAAHAPANSRLDPIWRYFGTLSYPVYVIHYPLVVVFSNLAKAHRLNSYALTGAAFATLLVVLLAANLASRFYDIPVRRWLARDSQRRASVQQPIAQIDQPSP
jgi:peptidoglycan/LPS O-acetylase OafA/YrhL